MARRGRPRKGEIRNPFLGLTPEEQMRRDALIREKAPQDGYEPFTYELLQKIQRLPSNRQRGALKGLGEIEWSRCAKNVFYWIDNEAHPMPYVYTLDPREMYVCNLCTGTEQELSDIAWGRFQTKIHLENTHDMDLKGTSVNEILQHFHKISPTRPWTMKEYFRPIIQAWLDHPFFVIEKSRDMMATWLFTTLYTWDTLYHEGQQNIFQSDDTEKTRELVEKRAYFLFLNQPKFLREVHPARFEVGISKGGRLFVPDLNSEIIGIAQGPDQIRYLHPAGVLVDEAAFHNSLAQTVGAIKPAIEKGGRITLVSSANPGFFQALAQDFSER